MEIRASDTPAERWSGDSLVLGLHADETGGAPWTAVDQALGGALTALIADAGFAARRDEVAAVRLAPGAAVGNLVLAGLGDRERLTLDGLRRAAALAVRWVKRGRGRSLGVAFPAWNGEAATSAEVVAEGIELALHEGQWSVLQDRFKAEDGLDPPPRLERLEILALGDPGPEALARARATIGGIVLSRELAAAPPNIVGPAELADWAARIAQAHGLDLQILDRSGCAARDMGGFLGAARGSEAEPRLIHLCYRPPGAPSRRLAVVGLGLTFDPLGLDKGSERRIEGMKKAMGGAASVLGAAQALGEIGGPAEVHFVIPAAEAGSAGPRLRPGDLFTLADGKTVEVNEADQEGRLLLAEALLYARGQGVDALLDIATLSPACVAGLGEEIAGLWATDDGLAAGVARAAERAGEAVWRLPLADRYEGLLWAPFANLRTAGPPAGEALTAALFLRRFTGGVPWAHLDITGPVWSRRVDGYYNAGATGFGVGTLLHWMRGQ